MSRHTPTEIAVLFQLDEAAAIQDERESRKEQLLQVAQRVQSEYSFRYVASGSASHEDLSGLASTDEYVQCARQCLKCKFSLLISARFLIVFR